MRMNILTVYDTLAPVLNSADGLHLRLSCGPLCTPSPEQFQAEAL